MIRNTSFLFLLLCTFFTVDAQKTEVAALNDCISFSNECTHGMLIVHRLLENFNQDVNKFVDLESKQVNFYSNKDLPENVFDDPDKWFYDKSPNEWYRECMQSLTSISDKKYRDQIVQQVSRMYKIVNEINYVRYKAENYLNSNDLNNKDLQPGIYEILESGVKYFDQFYRELKLLKYLITEYAIKLEIPIRSDINVMHNHIFHGLEILRKQEEETWQETLADIKERKAKVALPASASRKLDLFIREFEEAYQSPTVSEDYQLYGKDYFYHNSKLLNYTNRYGNGYVNAYNSSVANSKLQLFEIPHFYKVVYPNRWVDTIPEMEIETPMPTPERTAPEISSNLKISEVPKSISDREIVPSNKVILVSSREVELELYDHQMIDGDIVSVNFNGEWVLEKHPLKGKPYILNITLNETGKNYLVLHAENLGKQPPNTMALRYMYKGKKEKVVLTSNMAKSEMIEIEIK